MNEGTTHFVGNTTQDQGRAQTHEEDSVDLFKILISLYHGKWTLFAVASGAFGIATVIAFLIPPQFTSKASFLPPNSNGGSSSAALMGQISQFSGSGAAGLLGGVKSPGDLYVGILKSQSVESEIVKRFDLKRIYSVKKESQAEQILTTHSKFEVGAKDPIVTISVTDKDPARAHDLTDGYLVALREANGRLALSESSQRRLFFEQQLTKEKDSLADAEVDLKKAQEQSGLIAPEGQTASYIRAIAETRAQIASRQVALSSLRQSSTPQNPELIRLQSEIGNLQSQLALLRKGTDNGESGAIPISKVPGLELDYVRKVREVKYHEALFEILAKQYEAARMDESREAPLLQVLDAASYPDTKSSPKRMLIMLGGLILGCFAGGAWILMREGIYSIRARFTSSTVSS